MLRDVIKITINQTGTNIFYRVNFATQLIWWSGGKQGESLSIFSLLLPGVVRDGVESW